MLTDEKRIDNGNGYLKLPDKFTSKNFNFVLLKRKGSIAIYLKQKDNYVSKTYEVIRITEGDEYEIHGVKVPPKEYYPSDSVWGAMGWTYQTEKEALDKFKDLCKIESVESKNKN